MLHSGNTVEEAEELSDSEEEEAGGMGSWIIE